MKDFSADEVLKMMNRTTTQYEVERKFLLKRVPDTFLEYGKQIRIINFYLTNEDIKNGPAQSRIRIQEEDGVKKIIKTNKAPIGLNFALQELEVELKRSEFEKYIPYITQYIKKTRYRLDINNKKWEVDKFDNISLVIAELEECAVTAIQAEKLEKEIKKYKLPSAIKQHLIAEVTEDRQFCNLSLSEALDSSVEDLLMSIF